MKHQFLKKLTKKMNDKLPGKISHEIMMVKPRFKSIEKKASTPAAVLILLYPIKDKWHFFLTKRTNNVEHHKGQISLPGGMLEKGESHKEAAIRETFEELGVQSRDINIIGPLTPLYIPISNFKIFPFVGWLKSSPKLNIQSKEVSKVFSPSIYSLTDPKTKKGGKPIVSVLPGTALGIGLEIPLSTHLKKIYNNMKDKKKIWEHILYSGEDYELLFSVSPKKK